MRVLLLLIILSSATTVWAGIDAADFDSETMRQRYQSLVNEMRCPKCQNQNLAGSDSPIAADLRREIRRLLHEGYSDEAIADYLVARYGDFVLYRPRWQTETYLLWFTPFVLFSATLLAWFWVARRRKVGLRSEGEAENMQSSQLDVHEQALLDKVLVDEANSGRKHS